MRSVRIPVVLLTLASMALGACAPPGPGPLQLGVKAIALDLAFREEDLASPVEAEVIVRMIPAPPQIGRPDDLFDFPTPPAGVSPVFERPFVKPCPTAGPGAAPKLVATLSQAGPPMGGSYGRHNEGTFAVTGAAVDVTLPYPFYTHDQVTDVREIAPPGLTDPAAGSATEPDQSNAEDSGYIEWTTTHVLTNDISVSTKYRLTPSAIQIIERTSRTADTENTIRPVPPVDLMQLNEGEGHSWSTAGVDSDRSTAFQIDGKIERREPMDVCGELVDTYRVITTETVVNLIDGSVTSTNEPSRYNIATQYGGLIVETEQHYTERSRDPKSGSPIQITFDYISTLDSIEPERAVEG